MNSKYRFAKVDFDYLIKTIKSLDLKDKAYDFLRMSSVKLFKPDSQDVNLILPKSVSHPKKVKAKL